MGTRKTRDLPARLAEVRRRIERWRRTRKVRSRIPEPLWALAVEVAGTYGIHQVAKALRLSYYALKKRVIEGGTTVFLRQAGAPLDNNLCEQALKKVIRHRRNSLFYKTRHGAHVGDVSMSLIHTCEVCGVNPFDYLTELERHTAKAASNPQDWMPWSYRQALSNTAPAFATR
jgi:hypothetical protein